MSERIKEEVQVLRVSVYSPLDANNDRLAKDLYSFSSALTGLQVRVSQRDRFMHEALRALGGVCRGLSVSFDADGVADDDTVPVLICGVPAGSIQFIALKRGNPFAAIQGFRKGGES